MPPHSAFSFLKKKKEKKITFGGREGNLTQCMWGSELVGVGFFFFFFYHVGSRDLTQVMRLAGSAFLFLPNEPSHWPPLVLFQACLTCDPYS